MLLYLQKTLFKNGAKILKMSWKISGKKHKNVVHCQKFIKWYGNGFGIFHFPVSILFFVWDSPDYALTNGI